MTDQTYFAESQGFSYERRPVRLQSLCWSEFLARKERAGRAADFWAPPSAGRDYPVLLGAGDPLPVDAPGIFALVRPDGPLHFFCVDPDSLANPPDTAHAAGAFGIEPDTGSPQTSAINAALAEISAAGGGTLRLRRGIYDVTTVRLQSGTTLWLDEGAVLRASAEADDYPLAPAESVYPDLPPSLIPGARRRVIEADHVEGAAVRGRGVIDGQGSEIRRRTMAAGRPLINLVYAVGCRDLVFEGVTLLDSEFWNTHLILCDDVRFSFVKIINEIPPPAWAASLGNGAAKWTWNNADGINPDSSERILVENCLLHTGDDCLPVKNTGTYKNILRNVRDVTCRRCVMATPVTAMKIGTETRGQLIENILFEGNLVVGCGRAIGAELKDGAAARNVTFRNIRVRECNRPFDIQILRRQDHPQQSSFSRLESARIEGLIIDRHAINGEWFTSHVHGLDHEHPARGVVITDCSLSGNPLASCGPENLETNEFVEMRIV